MGRFYCDYCGMYLTHDSPGSRKQHRFGWKHRENFRKFYEQIVSARREEEQRRFFLEKGLPVPPIGMPPPNLIFNFPPPALPGAIDPIKRIRLQAADGDSDHHHQYHAAGEPL